MKNQFKFSAEGRKALIAKNKLILVIIFALIFVFSIFVRSFDTSTFISMGIAGIIFLIIARKSFKKQIKILESLELIIDNESIRKIQIGIPEQSIMKNEIISIKEDKNKGMMIRTKDKKKLIYIPKEITGYDEIRKILNEWHDIEHAESRQNILIIQIVQLLLLVMMFIVILSENRSVVIILGILFIISMLVSGIFIFMSNQIDKKTKYSFVLIMMLPLIGVLSKISIML